MTRLSLLLLLVALGIVAIWMVASDPFTSEEFRPWTPPEPEAIPDETAVARPEPVVETPVPTRPAGEPRRLQEILKLGLEWLAANQAADGSWSSEFDEDSRPAVTGLALLAFHGAGETHRHGRHKKAVRAGLKYLGTHQRPDGRFGPHEHSHYAANNAIATLAMCEAYGMTGSPLLKQSAQLGVDHGVKRGVSRVWDVMVLRSASSSGLRVPETWKEDAELWLNSVTDPKSGVAKWPSGRMVPDTVEAQTAAIAMVRMGMGAMPESEIVEKAIDVVARRSAEVLPDPGLVYFGTAALFSRYYYHQAPWRKWRAALRPVGTAQDDDGFWEAAKGSDRLIGRAGRTALILGGLQQLTIRRSFWGR